MAGNIKVVDHHQNPQNNQAFLQDKFSGCFVPLYSSVSTQAGQLGADGVFESRAGLSWLVTGEGQLTWKMCR